MFLCLLFSERRGLLSDNHTAHHIQPSVFPSRKNVAECKSSCEVVYLTSGHTSTGLLLLTGAIKRSASQTSAQQPSLYSVRQHANQELTSRDCILARTLLASRRCEDQQLILKTSHHSPLCLLDNPSKCQPCGYPRTKVRLKLPETSPSEDQTNTYECTIKC